MIVDILKGLPLQPGRPQDFSIFGLKEAVVVTDPSGCLVALGAKVRADPERLTFFVACRSSLKVGIGEKAKTRAGETHSKPERLVITSVYRDYKREGRTFFLGQMGTGEPVLDAEAAAWKRQRMIRLVLTAHVPGLTAQTVPSTGELIKLLTLPAR